MARTRKKLQMLVTVSVPMDMSASQARKEVRELITNQRNYSADPDEVKAFKVQGAGRVRS